MKIVLIILGGSIVLAIGYFLYQIELGAIPFLLGAIFLFYLGYRLIPRTPIGNDTDGLEDESPKK